MTQRLYATPFRACTIAVAITLSAVALCPQSSVAGSAGADRAVSRYSGSPLRLAQLPRFLASGSHQCGQASEKRSCVVSGEFSDCNEARGLLQTRDCCPSSAGGGRSTRFTLLTCIPNSR